MEKWEIRPPLPQKPVNRLSPKFAWVITSWTPTPCKISPRYDYPLSPPNTRKCASSDSANFFWFFLQPTAKTPASICTINRSNDVISRKDVPFGGPENKILHFDPHFPQKPLILGQFLMGLRKFRVKKALTMGMLESKLPLIVIVAP